MTGNTGCRQSQKRSIQILVLDGRSFLRRNVRSVVALVALQAGVLALEHISGLLMVERLGVPLDEREILPVVFGVAAGAFLARSGRDVVRGVESLVSLEAAGNLSMAFQTFEGGLTAELVATGTIRRSVKRLMRPR